MKYFFFSRFILEEISLTSILFQTRKDKKSPSQAFTFHYDVVLIYLYVLDPQILGYPKGFLENTWIFSYTDGTYVIFFILLDVSVKIVYSP